jgi:phage terminase large subunit-like protein
VPCAPLFPDEAEAALNVFRALKIVDAPGSPTMGEVCRPWVLDFVSAVFGAYDHDTGRRLIREFFLLISKKNGKSTIAAGIMLTALIRNWRTSGEFLILAPTIEIANNSFFPARDMIRHDEELSDLLAVQDHYRAITHRNTKATLKVVAADNETVGGKKAIAVLIDELWLFGKRPDAQNMLREATGGLASRPEGFTILLSTQSDDQPAGVFRQALLDYRDIRDGKLDDRKRMGVLYEFPQRMLDAEAYRDPTQFYVTNPNLGASVDEEFLRDEALKATRSGPQSYVGFAAKHLNIEIGISLRGNRWSGAEFWSQRADPTITLDAILERCEVVVVGIDGGGLDDLFGLALLGRERDTKAWLLWSHGWAHKGVLERRKSIATRLAEFAAAGELTIVDDQLEDLSAIVAIVARVKDAGLLGGVAVDPAGLGEFVDAMAEIEVTQDAKLLIGVGQGYRMMNAIKTAERRLASGTLRHSGSGLMAWCVANLKIEPTATAIRATKQNAGDAKIDPAMAMFDAVDIMSTNPDANGISIYETMSDETAAEFGLQISAESVSQLADRMQIDGDEREILANPRHPRWQEVRERFEERLVGDGSEDEF